MQDEETQVCGVAVIEDHAGLGVQHLRHFDQKSAKLFTSLLQVLMLKLSDLSFDLVLCTSSIDTVVVIILL